MKNVKTLALGTTALAMVFGVIAFANVPARLAAQEPTLVPGQSVVVMGGSNVITVSGVGTAYGAPDVAYIGVGADFTSENAGEAFSQASDTMNAVREALLELGIAEQDLQTTNVSIYPQDSYGPDGNITGRTYRVSNALNVTVRDITMIEQVINASIEAGANNLYNLSFGIADPGTLEQDARTQAVANAQARAEQLAGLLGVTVGAPVAISETLSDGNNYPIAVRNTASDMAFGTGGGVPIDTGRMMVSVQVEITFAIGQ
jgi:uncharacterized protein